VFVALLRPVSYRTLVHIALASAITSTQHSSALLNCRLALPIFTAIAAAASIRPDRIYWFFSLSILFTAAVMYGGSADVIVTVRSGVVVHTRSTLGAARIFPKDVTEDPQEEYVRQHAVETIIFLLWIFSDVFRKCACCADVCFLYVQTRLVLPIVVLTTPLYATIVRWSLFTADLTTLTPLYRESDT